MIRVIIVRFPPQRITSNFPCANNTRITALSTYPLKQTLIKYFVHLGKITKNLYLINFFWQETKSQETCSIISPQNLTRPQSTVTYSKLSEKTCTTEQYLVSNQVSLLLNYAVTMVVVTAGMAQWFKVAEHSFQVPMPNSP